MQEQFTIKMLGVNPTYKCNLNCYMCGQRKMDELNLAKELDIEKLKETIIECKKHGLQYGVYLWGGEPLLYSKCEELLKFIGERHIFITINTNGVLLDKYTDLIIENKILCRLIVSIDGIELVHDKIRGVEGTYKRIKSNIEYINAIRKRTPIISTNTVITSENYYKLYDVMWEISKMGVDSMECQLPIFFSDECGQKYEEKMKQCFRIEANKWRGFRGSYSDVNVNILMEQIDKIKANFGNKFKLSPDITNEQMEMYFTNADDICLKKVCSLPFSQIHIEPDGNIVICPDFPDYIIGNINDSKLDELWFSDKYKAFRKMILEEKLPICSRCCQYYQF